MAGGKETPRQKMIGMMYLVLTALLALNVSKEILNAFIVVNTGLENTNINFNNKNEVTYAAFDKAMLNDEKKTRKYYEKAITAKKLSKDLSDYIEKMKTTLMRMVDGNDTVSNLRFLETKDNYDISTHYLIGEDPENADGEIKILKDKIKKYREDLLNLVDPKERAGLRIGLSTDKVYSFAEESVVTWENNAFYHSPIAAVITILSKLQNDVKNAESDVIGALYKQIDVGSFKFDTLSARIVAKSNYVLIGDEYSAEIFVAAFSTTSNPEVWLGQVDSVKNTIIGSIDSTSVKVAHGVGTYTTKPTSDGEQKLGGLIRIKNPVDNSWVSYPFKTAFIAAKPAAVVSADNMNVFYIGVDNPVSISCAGVSTDKLRPSMSGGSINPGPGGKGHYIVKLPPGSPKTVKVSVSASFGDGNKNMGTSEFRVKTVPDPVASFGGKSVNDASNAISKAAALAAQGVAVNMVGFDFPGQLFSVVSFNLTMIIAGVEVTKSSVGASLSSEQKTLINKIKSGSKIYIEAIRVKGPDGSIRNIPGPILKVQ